MRKRCDTDADADAQCRPGGQVDAGAFIDLQCRPGGGHLDVAYSHAFRYTDANALGGPAACPGPAATDDVARRTTPGRVVLSTQQ